MTGANLFIVLGLAMGAVLMVAILGKTSTVGAGAIIGGDIMVNMLLRHSELYVWFLGAEIAMLVVTLVFWLMKGD